MIGNSQSIRLEAHLDGALINHIRLLGYALWRTWSEDDGHVMFIGLNPSTADETEDDPTIRRCIGFAKSWGYGGIYMLNLFAFRATDPQVMKAAADPVGPSNDEFLCMYAESAGLVVVAWGAHGVHHRRDEAVRRLISPLHHLGLTKSGQPKHPLYLRGDTKPRAWLAGEGKETT